MLLSFKTICGDCLVLVLVFLLFAFLFNIVVNLLTILFLVVDLALLETGVECNWDGSGESGGAV